MLNHPLIAGAIAGVLAIAAPAFAQSSGGGVGGAIGGETIVGPTPAYNAPVTSSAGSAPGASGSVVASEESTVTIRRREVPVGVIRVPVQRPLLDRGSVSGGIGGAIGGRSIVGVTPAYNADLVVVPDR